MTGSVVAVHSATCLARTPGLRNRQSVPRPSAADVAALIGALAPIAPTAQIDLLIEDAVVVEVKAVDALLPVHKAQVLTYLRLTGCPAGLLINFNVPRLTDGVRRLLNPKREGAERTEPAGSHGGAEQRR